MLLINILIYLCNIFIAQAAIMKITNSPHIDHLKSQKSNYQAVFNNGFKNKKLIKRDYAIPNPICEEPLKTIKPKGREECEPYPSISQQFEATHQNGDAFIEKKTDQDKGKKFVRIKVPSKRETVSNKTLNGNFSAEPSKTNFVYNDSYDKVSKFLHRDLDNFYDNELIRKLSDSNGKLPISLKLVLTPNKEPLVVYNESEEDSFSNRNFIKREAVTSKSNIYYDYNYYEDQPSDNTQLNSGPYKMRKKYSNERVPIVEEVRSLNSSSDDSYAENKKAIILHNDTGKYPSTHSTEMDQTFEPITIRSERNMQYPINRTSIKKDTRFRPKESFETNSNVAALRKATCAPADGGPGKQGCHPGGGLPKNPIMPSLVRNGGKDPEYDKLLRGETSERVMKVITEKVHKNQKMALELGICDFDIGELRYMLKQMNKKDKKDCCSKLRGEFKCFLTWLLTIDPSRKKRSEIYQDGPHKFSTCDTFPKFDLMGSQCYKKPSPQYEKLVQRVEEYKDENNVK